MSVTSVLLVAHGSRLASSNEEVRELAGRLAAQANGRFHQVCAAFLELAKPSIPEGIERCVEAGADEVLVLPYFLSVGRHVAEDVPAQVALAHTGAARVHILPHLGAAEGLPSLLLTLVFDGARTP